MAQKCKPKAPDFILLFSTIVLLAIGLVMVLSASSLFSFREFNNSYYLFYKQLQWAFLGIVLAFIVMFIPYKYWKKLSGLCVIFSLILLLLVQYTDLGVKIKGSTRWVQIAGISFQPSEIAKFSLVLFFAYMLSRYPVKGLKDAVIPVFVMCVFAALIYKQPDLGTTVLILVGCSAMLFITELSVLYFIAAVPICGLIGYNLIKDTPYQWNRILGWLYPWDYASSYGYQSVNAQIAFGTGGLLGIGIGRSSMNSHLPESYADTIFAVIGEEFGFFGTSLVVLLFVLLISRGYVVSKQCGDRFGYMLGFGITTFLALQIALNLGVVTGLLPVTGITLPLISYGGTSLVITLVQIGILLNISRYRQDKSYAEAEIIIIDDNDKG